jgi:N-acetylneuraminate lyase
MNHAPLHGLVAATHTPFDADGGLNLVVVERQAEHLLRAGVETVFIGGSTGECHSLTVDERLGRPGHAPAKGTRRHPL